MQSDNLVKPRILIADDEESHRTLLTLILEEEGWDVREAKNGKEALEKILKEQPEVLILDNHMPELTGVEVYQHLQEKGIKLAVIMVSSCVKIEEIASSLGIFYFLNKPFDIPDLINMINCAYKNFLT
ncbi:response regulator [Anabaena sp. 4-3]|uniref:response regulator n=1 Tax=Anabaena sp. 4-3 TaxID=1811979 RepID=UPI0008319DDF|nr:response regulator [Anabaena sp. 4-3]